MASLLLALALWRGSAGVMDNRTLQEKEVTADKKDVVVLAGSKHEYVEGSLNEVRSAASSMDDGEERAFAIKAYLRDLGTGFG